MLSAVKTQLQECVMASVKECFAGPDAIPGVEIEIPNEKSHGEFSTTIALKATRLLKRPPLLLAEEFSARIRARIQGSALEKQIAGVEVVKPGFINFRLSPTALYGVLEQVFVEGDRYGHSDFGAGQKVQIEFVSANPTGPLSVAHARQAAVGDCLGNVMRFAGFDVTKEYYVNDEGNQINILGRSIRARARELLGDQTAAFPDDGYQGDYIRDMARDFLGRQGITDVSGLAVLEDAVFSAFGVEYLLAVIRKELNDFGVHFDVWSRQSRIASAAQVEEALAALKEKDYLYEKDGALWFRTTSFGDDKDRVLRKSDGSFTYFAPDIAYHRDKYRRGFDRVVNIWGPDHHGYIPRMKAAVVALGRPEEALQVLIVQLATIFRDGQPVSMSTRRGQYISLQEVMDEVGVDAARFFFLMRSIKAHLDFDLELAKRETPENPVYYIQYAHARVHSIVSKAGESDLMSKTRGFALLSAEEELALLKMVGYFPDILVLCCRHMDVFALVNYLLELATAFHRFYDKHRVVDPSSPALSSERLALIDAVRIVIANGLRLVGVQAPVRM